MISRPELKALAVQFLAKYSQAHIDAIWLSQSAKFRGFWNDRIMATGGDPLTDDECDQIIAILDRNGKGNRKGSEAVAKVMVPQGAWRKLFNEFHNGRPELGQAVDKIFKAESTADRAAAIDAVYELNDGAKNRLTGASGNAIGAMLAAWDTKRNLSMISLTDRKVLLDYLGMSDLWRSWGSGSTGTLMAFSNDPIIGAARELGLPDNARTITAFFYTEEAKDLWRKSARHVVKVPGGEVSVEVPTDEHEEEVYEEEDEDGPAPGQSPAGELRESMKIQAILCRIGAAMGYKIWLPRNDRSRVQQEWQPEPGQLLDNLPILMEDTTLAIVEQIDVLWIGRRAIVRAFEVEGTTAIYSGLLRMADLVALQPNLKIKLHIVASSNRRAKVMTEIKRPVFALLEGGELRSFCTYLSYDNVRLIGENAFLKHTSESVLEEFEEYAEEGGF